MPLSPLQIGPLRIARPVALAPMAGVTNLPFRLLAKEQGVGLVCSETLSARGVVEGGERTHKMASRAYEEGPMAAQIFGCDPDILAEAAAILEAKGIDVLDINFGCPVSKFVRSFSGAVLMREPDKIRKIVTAVRKRIRIPLTVKMRSGWDAQSVNAPEIARIAEGCGVDAISIHPRTRKQAYTGRADWQVTRAVVKSVKVPVLGNGDVTTPRRAQELIDETGCAGVMIGRAALGNPWIFSQVRDFFEKGTFDPAGPGLAERRSLMLRHLDAMIGFMGNEAPAVRVMRKHFAWYTKGLQGGALFRDAINRLETRAEAVEAIEQFLGRLSGDRETADSPPPRQEGPDGTPSGGGTTNSPPPQAEHAA